MGYYVKIVDAHCILPSHNVELAYNRWCKMNSAENGHLKNGGSWGPNGKEKRWYSWMPENYDTEFKTAEEILECLGFELDINEYGDISIIGYNSKSGQENLFLDEVKDLLVPDAWIKWEGEDGWPWSWPA